MRRIAATVISVIIALSAAAPATLGAARAPLLQAPPEPVVLEPFVTNLCGFPVLITLAGKGAMIQLPGGLTILTSPGLTATLTRVDDPSKRVTLNITGPVQYSVLANGDQQYVLLGRNLVLRDPAFGDLTSRIALALGRFTFVFDPTGTLLVQLLAGEGQLIDVCALLA